ncbi:Alpha-ketoglutarate-dependent dioxygenase AlkB [hydrothermal vent metagenome]|uniref:Alpha-ketoglutarate-dependent dioxygenase AlkB n=1 Tax=hydrothermal vent metagenome TaxID=652676 RepID=A0A3B0TF06_9ZZZZ
MRFEPEYLDVTAQAALLDDIAAILGDAPLVTPKMPRTGKPFSVTMSNCGALGWISDQAGGYRYGPHHPQTGLPWPAIPARLLQVWKDLARCPRAPQACLINHYGPGAKLGLHQDRDEADLGAPIVSLSLGDTAVFRLGGTARKGATQSFRLANGDAMVLEGASRLAFHGVDRILAGSSKLLDRHGDLFPHGGRINLTMRVVTPAS